MKKLTKWLKEYEVYFTALAAVFLSFMALMVSCVANRIANQQLKIDYFDKQADFQLSVNQIYNEKTKKYEEVKLELFKLSGKAKNIEIETITFMDIKYQNIDNVVKTSRFLLNGYYNSSFIYGKTEGLIQTLAGYKNNSRQIELENYIEDIVGHHSEFINIRLNSYAKLQYLNFQKENVIEYFDVSGITGKLISNDTLQRYFDPNRSPFTSDYTIDLRYLDNKERLFKIITKIK